MNIYITGIAGMLGGNIAYLLSDKYNVCGSDIYEINMPGIKFSKIDLLNYSSLEMDILSCKPKVLIHCAAAVNVDLCEADNAFARSLNSDVTFFLSEICKREGIKLIYISTDAVFDGEKDGLYTEMDIPNPINEYARTKLAGESHVLKNGGNMVVRTNIYGFNIQNKLSFGEWILTSLLNNESLNMFCDINFSPILVNDLTRVIDLIIEKDCGGLFNVCATGSVSKYDFGIYLKKIFNINQGFINKELSSNADLKAKRPRNIGLDNSLICNELNIKIRSPYESIELFKELYDKGYHNKLKRMGG